MDTLKQELGLLPTVQERIDHVECLLRADPNDLGAWLYLADHAADMTLSAQALDQIGGLQRASRRMYVFQ
jgi:hypothetical protein